LEPPHLIVLPQWWMPTRSTKAYSCFPIGPFHIFISSAKLRQWDDETMRQWDNSHY
jgi:hypothetical protein